MPPAHHANRWSRGILCSRLVGEIHAYADLKASWIERIVGSGKIVVAAKRPFIGVGICHIKARLLHAEIGIHIDKGKIAALHFLLIVEVHQRRVVGRRIVLGIVVGIGAELHFQHFRHGKFDE